MPPRRRSDAERVSVAPADGLARSRRTLGAWRRRLGQLHVQVVRVPHDDVTIASTQGDGSPLVRRHRGPYRLEVLYGGVDVANPEREAYRARVVKARLHRRAIDALDLDEFQPQRRAWNLCVGQPNFRA